MSLEIAEALIIARSLMNRQTSRQLLRPGTTIHGVLGQLPDPNNNLDVSAVISTLENNIGNIYEQDGIFHNPSFLETDYCGEVVREIMTHSGKPIKPREYILVNALYDLQYPVGAAILIVMQMRHRKTIYDHIASTSEKVGSLISWIRKN